MAASTISEADLYTFGVQRNHRIDARSNLLSAEKGESIKDALQSDWSKRAGAKVCGHVSRRGLVGGEGGSLALQGYRGAESRLIQWWGGRSRPGSAAASIPLHCS